MWPQPGFIDAGHPRVRAFAQRAVARAATDRERVSRLFTAVRDEIRYDPYKLSHDPWDYLASDVISRAAAFCIPKGVLLIAAARRSGSGASRLLRRQEPSPVTKTGRADGHRRFVFHR
jgi:transglutaminase-like putative cysteine protease